MPGKRHSVQDPAKRPTREGVIHCTEQVRGKTVKSISVSGVDNFNVVIVDFMDGTALSVEFSPVVKLKVEYNDWSVRDGKLLKSWPPMLTR
jgi:hypothetical protein